MRLTLSILTLSMALTLPVASWAQTKEETLADVRQQLSVLYVEMQRLKRELSTTGSPTGVETSGTTLQRLDAIEAELQRLTGRTEQLENRVHRVVEDGTNRIGDLEFRLVELEGGDVSQLGETTTLGGDVAEPDTSVPSLAPEETATELAVGEGPDFERAAKALAEGDFRSAADQFDAFLTTYPGSPLEPEAHLRRGEALDGLGETTRAARAYLDSYSGAPQSRVADEALFRLGKSLGGLGQTNEACVTLSEVAVRHPGSPWVAEAEGEMQKLSCN
ncbi:tol-pal system protein YbgF [Shimia sp. SDUM112013]|uniref:tol-pal system protein YbgF n=1 Tax=Shimia sp. SDUM112013 TaxID=3136160 RepID=UPI0032EB7000